MNVTPDEAGAARVGLEVLDPETGEPPAGTVKVSAAVFDAAGVELITALEPLDLERYAIAFRPGAPGDYRLEVAVAGAVESSGTATITVS